MTPPPAPGTVPRIDLSVFEGSPRFGRARVWLRRLPHAFSVPLLEAVAVADGVRRGRYGQARAWARALGRAGAASHRLAFHLLRMHGRFAAEEALIGVRPDGDPGGATDLRGGEHLAVVTGGALLVGFHLGPPRAWLALRRHGWHVRMAARFSARPDDPRWEALVRAGELVPLTDSSDAARLQALYRIRALLGQGAPVFMTADGPFGRVLCRIPLAGAPLTVRAGWFAVRRQLRVPTLPVLTYAEGRNRVVEVHPPLPAPVDDETRDIEACHAALAPLLGAYVRAHPEQCRYLAFPPWDEGSASAEAHEGRVHTLQEYQQQ